MSAPEPARRAPIDVFGARRRPKLLVVDVFARAPLEGNPAAVVIGAGDLEDAALQAIARETNLSETVFLLAPREGGDYRARIFTTRREIPFAGHPSLAAAHAFAEESGTPQSTLVQECGLGRIRVARGPASGDWRVGLPAARLAPAPIAPERLAECLALSPEDLAPRPPRIGATGVPWLLLELAGPDAIARIAPDHRLIAQATRAAGTVGLVVFVRDPEPNVAATLRSFAPAEGIYEDPVCGSCAGALAALMIEEEAADATRDPASSFAFTQGREIGRPGLMSVDRAADGALVLGGGCITVLDGRLAPGEGPWHA